MTAMHCVMSTSLVVQLLVVARQELVLRLADGTVRAVSIFVRQFDFVNAFVPCGEANFLKGGEYRFVRSSYINSK